MLNLNQKVKFFLYPILYWIIFVIAPFMTAIYLSANEYGEEIDISGYIIFYVLFFAPFLFFIPFKMIFSKIDASLKKKILFVLFWLIIPYLLIYIYIYNGLMNAFGRMSL